MYFSISGNYLHFVAFKASSNCHKTVNTREVMILIHGK